MGKLKYRLKQLFVQVYGTESAIARAKTELASLDHKKRVPYGTIQYDINLTMIETAEVPDQRLQRYADFFGMTVDYIKADSMAHLDERKKMIA